MKKAIDLFNYRDLPRDGKDFWPSDTNGFLEQFLYYAEVGDTAYFLVPSPYISLIQEWASKTNLIKVAPETDENKQGGFFGTVCSVEIFTDYWAGLPDLQGPGQYRYPMAAPILCVPFGGQFTHMLEMERSPYYRAKHINDKHVERFENWESVTWIAHTVPRCILIPWRFESEFRVDRRTATHFQMRREMNDVESSLNGHIGWFEGVPVYIDSYLPRRMQKADDQIEVHYELQTQI